MTEKTTLEMTEKKKTAPVMTGKIALEITGMNLTLFCKTIIVVLNRTTIRGKNVRYFHN